MTAKNSVAGLGVHTSNDRPRTKMVVIFKYFSPTSNRDFTPFAMHRQLKNIPNLLQQTVNIRADEVIGTSVREEKKTLAHTE